MPISFSSSLTEIISIVQKVQAVAQIWENRGLLVQYHINKPREPTSTNKRMADASVKIMPSFIQGREQPRI